MTAFNQDQNAVNGEVATDSAGVFAFPNLPAPATYGNAGRNTIPGIPNVNLNAALFRTFRINDKRRLTMRLDSINPLNHVNVTGIGTTIGSINAGLPVAAGAMRTLSITLRLSF